MNKSKTAQAIEITHESVRRASEMGLIHLTAQDYASNGRTITVNDRELINFGSCSYLGIELDHSLKQGAIDAIMRHGTQFASSRAYVSVGLYEEAERMLRQIFKRPIILAASVTHGHLSNLPILVGDNDAVILDHQVHATVQMAANQLKLRGIKVEMIRHNNLDMLESRIQKLQTKYEKVWYMADGIYSMYGDFAPVKELHELLETYEKLHLYIDDAHGAGVFGKNGSGFVHGELPYHERMYLTIGLAKSFAGAGGVLVYPNDEIRQKVRTCGGTMIFSGPLQPSQLGATIASLKLHMSPRLDELQTRIRNKIAYFNLKAEELGVPVFLESASPICFIKVGLKEVGYRLIQKIMEAGFYANLAVYPSVPLKNSGIRLALTNHLTYQDIDSLLRLISRELPKCLAKEDTSIEEVIQAFKVKF